MKKFSLVIALVAVSLFLSISCKNFNYYAEIEISNIGELPINACVDNDCIVLNPGESGIFEISWQDAPKLIVDLYAELFDGSDWDEATVSVLDGDELLWETGWDMAYKIKRKSNDKKN